MRCHVVRETRQTPQEGTVLRWFSLPILVNLILVGGLAFVLNEGALFPLRDSRLLWFVSTKYPRLRLLFFTHPDLRSHIALLTLETGTVFKFLAYGYGTFRDRPRGRCVVISIAGFDVSCVAISLISLVALAVLTPVSV